MSNSHGNSDKQIRKFLRENGVPPTMANVERIGREVRRTEAQNERVERIHKELEAQGKAARLSDEKGDVIRRVQESLRRKMNGGR